VRRHSRVEASWIKAENLAASVVSGGNAAEVLQLEEEGADQVAFLVEPLAEAGFPLPMLKKS
jgi:hypothetical protein